MTVSEEAKALQESHNLHQKGFLIIVPRTIGGPNMDSAAPSARVSRGNSLQGMPISAEGIELQPMESPPALPWRPSENSLATTVLQRVVVHDLRQFVPNVTYMSAAGHLIRRTDIDNSLCIQGMPGFTTCPC